MAGETSNVAAIFEGACNAKEAKTGHSRTGSLRAGLRLYGVSWAYGKADDQESLATLDRALELGVTFFDTAEAYGPFKNEELLGKAFKGRRERVIIATKFGFRVENGKLSGTDSRPAHVKEVAEASLRRLQTNYIDLFYQHRVDRTVPIEDVVGAMAELVREGKVRYLGLSEAGEDTIRRAHRTHPITALQSENPSGSGISSRASSRCCANSASACSRSRRSAADF